MNDTVDLKAAKQALLLEWEREREELNLLISRLRRDLGLEADADVPSKVEYAVPIDSLLRPGLDVNVLVKPGDFFGMSQVQASAEFLRRTKQACTLQLIADALFRGKAADTRLQGTALRNLSSVFSRSDEFISVARGRWGLSEWYPNRSKRIRKTRDAGQEPLTEPAG